MAGNCTQIFIHCLTHAHTHTHTLKVDTVYPLTVEFVEKCNDMYNVAVSLKKNRYIVVAVDTVVVVFASMDCLRVSRWMV